jgi:hypothetical protein
LDAALWRVLSAEVLPLSSHARTGVSDGVARLHGVYRHLYDTNAGYKASVGEDDEDEEEKKNEEKAPVDGGTDYVNFAYALHAHECYGRPELERLSAGGLGGSSEVDVEGDGQHTSFRWFTPAEVASDAEVHPYVKCYFHPHAHNRLA